MKTMLEILNGVSETWQFEEGTNLFWKEVARTGVWRSNSGKVVSINTDYFDELVKNFDAGADVPVPLGHDGRYDASKNTGYIKALERRGESLFAKFDITESGIADKIKNHTIKHNSIGVVLKEGLGRVLDHVALTLSPAMSGLKPFEATAFEAFEVNLFEIEPTQAVKPPETKKKGVNIMDEKELAMKAEFESKMKAMKEEFEAKEKAQKENFERKELEAKVELEMSKLESKIPPAKRETAKKLMLAGHPELVADLFESMPSFEEGKKPSKQKESSKEGKMKIFKASDLDKKYGREGVTRENFEALNGILKEVEGKKAIVVSDAEFNANRDLFEASGNEFFADYATALNQLNTGSFLATKIWETKLINQLAEGNFGYDAIAVNATRANGYEVQWTVAGTLSRKGTSTGVGTATGTAGITLSTVALNPIRYGNSVSWTEEINDWAVTNVQNNIAYTKLFEDYRETMDREAQNVLLAASAVLDANSVAGGTFGRGTANVVKMGTFNNEGAMTLGNILVARTILRTNRAAKFSDSSYVCFAMPEQLYSITTAGTGWVDAAKYADTTRLISGEVGKVMGVRFVDSDMVVETKGTNGGAAGTGTAYKAIMVGAEALGKGFDQMMKLTFYADDHDDGGYFKRLQWNARGRYARLKATEVVPIITTINQVFY